MPLAGADAANKAFPDVPNDYWAYQDIHQLTQSGAIAGYEDGTFKPESNISRAEFSRILGQALGLTTVHGNAFNDTQGYWAQHDIYTLVANNIIKVSDYGTNYSPATNITRGEIAVMMVRSLNLEQEALALSGQKTSFIDDGTIADYLKGYIVLAKDLGLISGYPDGSFQPASHASRAEASSMIIRLINQTSSPTPVPPETDNGNQAVTKNGVTLQTSQLVVTPQAVNALGEQWLTVTFDLMIDNQSRADMISSDQYLKLTALYDNGKASINAPIDGFTDTIKAGTKQTRTVTAHVLLPNNMVAQMVLGNQITGYQVGFYDYPPLASGLNIAANSQDHNVELTVLAQQLLTETKRVMGK